MHKSFTRALERRGIYTGVYVSWNLPVPRPRLYFVINPADNDMIRVEFGGRRRSFWIDWGHGRDA